MRTLVVVAYWTTTLRCFWTSTIGFECGVSYVDDYAVRGEAGKDKGE